MKRRISRLQCAVILSEAKNLRSRKVDKQLPKLSASSVVSGAPKRVDVYCDVYGNQIAQVLSEDFQHGRDIESVEFVNPFRVGLRGEE